MRTPPRPRRALRPRLDALEVNNSVSSLVPGLSVLAAVPLIPAEIRSDLGISQAELRELVEPLRRRGVLNVEGHGRGVSYSWMPAQRG